ncbi:MAG: hypothetical protein IPM77_16815 [Crocinitomicaceae bacterium]|nr:hypothetical protein [Crocinitomicaceae bacterium]
MFLALTSKAQMLEAGDGVVELGLGFPNPKPHVYYPGGFFHNYNPFSDNSDFKFGQLVAKGEFLMSDRIGIAAQFNYGYFKEYNEAVVSEYDPLTGSYNNYNYYYNTKIHKFRLLGGFHFHVVRTYRTDGYLGIMVGGKNVIAKSDTNDPNVIGELTSFQLPFIARVHFGLRIFATEHFAIHTELGLGGPAFSFGATYKF